VIIFCFLNVVLPFGLLMDHGWAWRLLLLTNAVTCSISLWKQFGVPSGDWKIWAANALQDDNGQYFLLSVLFILTNPHAIIAAPLVFNACVYFAQWLHPVLRGYLPPVFRILGPYVRKVIELENDKDLLNASFEPVIGLSLFIMIFLSGLPGVLQFLMWIQFLRVRCQSNHLSREAAAGFRMQLDSVFYHPRCPGLVRNLYTAALQRISKYF